MFARKTLRFFVFMYFIWTWQKKPYRRLKTKQATEIGQNTFALVIVTYEVAVFNNTLVTYRGRP